MGGQGGGSPGEQGAGGVRETAEERAGSGREIQKDKLSLIVTVQTNDFYLRSPRLKAKYICEKSQKTKIRIRDKKKTALL